ncbi:synaptic vesicle 2-related protein-like isoform X2 [Actinia tenebrosa]|uniref:Synaptic vesicle 2-related protein-like isoform X2 n=1 Tax=Actinia tenebrosa TaxID=6105 RepID=A0A6P8IU67_ACTTE|nr:synaptic vesicle 2-related protein-like isoform X2 [Actinia tenebrosa]
MSDDDKEQLVVDFSNRANRSRLLSSRRRRTSTELQPFLQESDDLPTFERENRAEEEIEDVQDSGQTYNVSEAVEKLGFGMFQARLIGIVGFFVIADALEMMLLSILAPTIRCLWHLDSVEEAFITTVVFVGMMIGSSFWGWIADSLGRFPTVIVSAAWIFYFGLLSAFSPHYYWIISLRCLVGFGIGGSPQSTTLLSEFLPAKSRAICILSLAIFWAIGSTFTVAVAMAVMPTLGWRWLLAILSLPLLIFLIMSKWLPESVRFYLAAGDREKAIQVLKQCSRINKKELPPGELKDANTNKPRGRIVDLFLGGQWKTTILLWIIWFNLAFSYYGIVLTTTELYQSYSETGKCGEKSKAGIADCGCSLLTMRDYIDMMWTTLAEFPGIIVTMLIIDYLGRKKTAAIEFLATVIFYVLLMFCSGRGFMTFCIFGVRGFISGAFQTFFVYTPEVYPTINRALGLGCCSAISRIGAMLTPFVAQVLLKVSAKLALGMYAFLSAISIIATLLLPIETGGRAMVET